MNKQKLYDKIKAMAPVKSDENKDYREIVRETLNGYFFDVKQLDVALDETGSGVMQYYNR